MMSDNEMVNHIRSVPAFRRRFDALTHEERRTVLFIAGGDAGQVAEALDFVYSERRDKQAAIRRAA